MPHLQAGLDHLARLHRPERHLCAPSFWVSSGVVREGSIFGWPDRERFERVVLPHFDAAHNLARWLLRGRADAEDVAQESMLRAFQFFDSYRGGDPKAWLLRIVRNTCYNWLEKNQLVQHATSFDEELHGAFPLTPEMIVIDGENHQRLSTALEELPASFREIFVLREMEGYSYKEIAAITSLPIGTVMSSLSRARKFLLFRVASPRTRELRDAS